MPLLRLRFVRGPRRGEELIFAGPRVRIGRSRDNTLVLAETDNPTSSARHAEALVERGAWYLVDSGSTNGTFVNGVGITRARLRRGDVVQLGDDEFVVSGESRLLAAAAVAGVALVAAASAWIATDRRDAAPYEQLAKVAARSVYAVVVESSGTRSVVGTAFAIDATSLATNAHVAALVRSGAARAVLGDTFTEAAIVGIRPHPRWKPGSLDADVALLHLAPDAGASPLPLAPAGAFAHLERGMTLASFGFPAIATDARRPRGRLSVDVVGDVRGDYLEAGLSIAPGTSGSPVFDARGEVVAVVAAGDFVKGADGRVTPSGSRVNWAISVELVRELLTTTRASSSRTP